MKLPNYNLLVINIAEVLANNCTGMDDHDDKDCSKCAAMQDALIRAVEKWFARVI